MDPESQARVPLGLRSRWYDGPFKKLDSRLVPKAHTHDPRIIKRVPPAKRYSDLIAQWDLKRAWKECGVNHFPIGGLAQTPSTPTTSPLQVQNQTTSVLLALIATTSDDPNIKLAIPRNKYRKGFTISNFTQPGTVAYMTYGKPAQLEPGLIGGHPIQPGQSHIEPQGGVIAIDDIYVFIRADTPIYLIVSEETVAPEANIS